MLYRRRRRGVSVQPPKVEHGQQQSFYLDEKASIGVEESRHQSIPERTLNSGDNLADSKGPDASQKDEVSDTNGSAEILRGKASLLPTYHSPDIRTASTEATIPASTSTASLTMPPYSENTATTIMPEPAANNGLFNGSSSTDIANSSADCASGPVDHASLFDALSTVPAYSDISWKTATQEERLQEIKRLQLRIRDLESSSYQERALEAETEITILRAYVTQLEMQLLGAGATLQSEEAPPEY